VQRVATEAGVPSGTPKIKSTIEHDEQAKVERLSVRDEKVAGKV
jgi:hypothetical protein